MGIVRKKYLSKKQNGGAPPKNKGPSMIKRGAISFGKGAKSVGTFLAKSTIGSPYYIAKYGAKPIAKGVVTAGVSVPLGIAAGTAAGVGRLGLGIGKSLYTLPVLGIQKLREMKARSTLKKKLGGLDMPTFSRKLDKYSGQQKALETKNSEEKTKIESKYAAKMSANITEDKIRALAAEKIKELESLEKKKQKQVDKLTTKTELISGKIQATTSTTAPATTASTTDTTATTATPQNLGSTIKATQDKLQAAYTAKKLEFETNLNTKKQDLNLPKKKQNLEGRKSKIQTELGGKQQKFINAKNALKTLTNNTKTSKNTTYYIDLATKKKELRDAQINLLKTKKNYNKESLNISKKEKELLKQTPKDLSFYEGKFYNRKTAVNKAKQSASYNFRAIPQSIVKGFDFGAKIGKKFGAYNITKGANQYAKSNSIKPKEYKAPDDKVESQYTLKERLFGPGVKGFTSTVTQAEKMKQLLDKSTPANLQLQINVITTKLSSPTTYENRIKLQSDLKQLQSDKRQSEEYVINAKQLIQKFTKQEEYDKNLYGLSTKTKPNVDTALASATTADKISKLEKEAISLAKTASTYNDYSKVRRLIRFHKAKLIEEQLKFTTP